MKLSVLLFLLLSLRVLADDVPKIIQYANGQILKNELGEVFYHDGSPFISYNGNMFYPPWQGKGKLRTMGFQPWMYYPNGSVLLEYTTFVHYPAHHDGEKGKNLFDNWSYSLQYGDPSLSAGNWWATDFFYPENVKARIGGTPQVLDQNERPTNESVTLYSPVGEFGYLNLTMQNVFDKLQFRFEIAYDLFHLSYIRPIRFEGVNQMPPSPFKEFEVQIETGVWGQLLRVYLTPDSVKYRFEQLPQPPPPYPYPYPPPFPPYPGTGNGGGGTGNQPNPHCPAAIVAPAYMRTDPPGFVRRGGP